MNKKSQKIDKLLIFIILISFFFSVQGINWGQTESWNPDQMAFRKLFHKGELLFNPKYFLKPPFHSYFNYFLSILPVQKISKILELTHYTTQATTLIWSRLLTVFLFLGSTVIIYAIIKKFHDKFSARFISTAFATSAGFMVYTHFLTSDLPLMFWMLLSFYYCQKIFYVKKVKNYVIAGFLIGITTATKYNGVLVGSALITFHIAANLKLSLKRIFINKNLFLGLLAISFGFLISNPFALLDYKYFLSDLRYLFATDKLYYHLSINGYLGSILKISELIGYPGLILFLTAFIYSVVSLILKPGRIKKHPNFIAALSVIIPYYLFFGSYVNIPTRYLVPIVPFLMIASGSFCQLLKKSYRLSILLLSLIIIYNLISSYYVGKRFLDDPRMKAHGWVKNNIPNRATIEVSPYTPNWKLINPTLNLIKTPQLTGREVAFHYYLKNNKSMLKILKQKGDSDFLDNVKWFSYEELIKRNPDFIAIDSLYYERFLKEDGEKYYPTVFTFFNNLLKEKYPYKIIFDSSTKPTHRWLYPKTINSLNNRLIILTKT